MSIEYVWRGLNFLVGLSMICFPSNLGKVVSWKLVIGVIWNLTPKIPAPFLALDIQKQKNEDDVRTPEVAKCELCKLKSNQLDTLHETTVYEVGVGGREWNKGKISRL